MKSMKKFSAMSIALVLSLGLFASCGEDTVQAGVDEAASYLYQIYKDTTSKSASFKVVAEVAIEGKVYPVSWSVAKKSGIDNVCSVGDTVDKQTTINVKYEYLFNTEASVYTLTGSVNNDKGTAKAVEKSFDFTVPEFKFVSISDFIKNGKNYTAANPAVVKGVVSAINGSKAGKSFTITDDSNSTIFCYKAFKSDGTTGYTPVLGNEIIVSSDFNSYSGFPQLGNSTAKVLNEENATGKLDDVWTKDKAYTSYTAAELFGKIADANKNMANYSKKLYKVTGFLRKDGDFKALFTTADGTDKFSLYASPAPDDSLLNSEIDVYCAIRGISSSGITLQAAKIVAKGAAVDWSK